MSKIGMSKRSLLTKKSAYHKNFYRHKLHLYFLFCYCNFFIFFAEKDLGVFSVAYLRENGNGNLEKKRTKLLLFYLSL
jgi:hypothetical protein